jgi:hypothetical protein
MVAKVASESSAASAALVKRRARGREGVRCLRTFADIVGSGD